MKNKEQFIKTAFYDGGKKAIDEFIQKNLKYPAAALEKKIEGKVHLFMDIDKSGKVTNIKVVSGIGHGCDEEAIRVVKMMVWQVDKVRNMHVVFHQRLTINFKLPPVKAPTVDIEPLLPTQQEALAPPTFSYAYVASTPNVEVKKEEEKTPEAPKIVYSYTIG